MKLTNSNKEIDYISTLNEYKTSQIIRIVIFKYPSTKIGLVSSSLLNH